MTDENARTLCCDIAVLGGGVSGVTAAIAAARQKKRVIIIEQGDFLGGVSVSGLGLLGFQDREGNTIVGGIAQELIDRLKTLHGTLDRKSVV